MATDRQLFPADGGRISGEIKLDEPHSDPIEFDGVTSVELREDFNGVLNCVVLFYGPALRVIYNGGIKWISLQGLKE